MTGRVLLIIIVAGCILIGYGIGWTTHAAYDANYVRQQEVNSYNQGFTDACNATGRTVC